MNKTWFSVSDCGTLNKENKHQQQFPAFLHYHCHCHHSWTHLICMPTGFFVDLQTWRQLFLFFIPLHSSFTFSTEITSKMCCCDAFCDSFSWFNNNFIIRVIGVPRQKLSEIPWKTHGFYFWVVEKIIIPARNVFSLWFKMQLLNHHVLLVASICQIIPMVLCLFLCDQQHQWKLMLCLKLEILVSLWERDSQWNIKIIAGKLLSNVAKKQSHQVLHLAVQPLEPVPQATLPWFRWVKETVKDHSFLRPKFLGINDMVCSQKQNFWCGNVDATWTQWRTGNGGSKWCLPQANFGRVRMSFAVSQNKQWQISSNFWFASCDMSMTAWMTDNVVVEDDVGKLWQSKMLLWGGCTKDRWSTMAAS